MDILIEEIKQELLLRVTEEGIPRIEKCISLLSEDEVWISPNDEIPSIGNLILHLNGNVRQWFLDGFCDVSYTREREKEFTSRKTHNKSQLMDIISYLSSDIKENIYKINLNKLTHKKMIQSYYFVSGFSIINHITEHFSYHVGQIATLTKLIKNTDLGFYADLDL